MDTQTPKPPSEAALIKEALRRVRLSGREAARRAGLSETRWRQIVNGYQDVGGVRIPVAAPDETLARMAQVVNVSADQLRQVGRSIAAELLDELAAPPTAASTPGAPDSNAQIEAITALLATLSPEVRQEVLRRISQPPANETGQTESQDNSRRRKAS
ncbi:helix-turn-helix transcriptional regulator [Streptomyces sp. Root369]|uniref:helix-turn-helix domain-containing protein n=1 Tax=Streptomyces sp. Root369 TaxID=1736523 RepID=UPI000A511C4D|nr:helix-turn-helix transcriptional regulator [Streptomyces sp. Root369]